MFLVIVIAVNNVHCTALFIDGYNQIKGTQANFVLYLKKKTETVFKCM